MKTFIERENLLTTCKPKRTLPIATILEGYLCKNIILINIYREEQENADEILLYFKVLLILILIIFGTNKNYYLESFINNIPVD